MQILDSEDELCNYKLGSFFVQNFNFGDKLRKVSALTILQSHVQILRRLESVNELEEERMVDSLHNLSFTHRVLYLVVANELLFLHDLKSKDLVRVFFYALKHPSKGPLANFLDHFEVFERGKLSVEDHLLAFFEPLVDRQVVLSDGTHGSLLSLTATLRSFVLLRS